MMITESSEGYQPTFKSGNYSHKVPVGYTLKVISSKGLDWVVIKLDGKDIVSISERPAPERSCKYRVYLHSYPSRKIQLADNTELYELFLSAPSNNIMSSKEVTKYIFSTDNVGEYSKLLDEFIELS